LLLLVAASGALYLGVGIIAGWLMDGKMGIPKAEFRDRVRLSLHAPVVTLCRCYSRALPTSQQV
jgi:hypothetical protein